MRRAIKYFLLLYVAWVGVTVFQGPPTDIRSVLQASERYEAAGKYPVARMGYAFLARRYPFTEVGLQSLVRGAELSAEGKGGGASAWWAMARFALHYGRGMVEVPWMWLRGMPPGKMALTVLFVGVFCLLLPRMRPRPLLVPVYLAAWVIFIDFRMEVLREVVPAEARRHVGWAAARADYVLGGCVLLSLLFLWMSFRGRAARGEVSLAAGGDASGEKES